MYILHGWAPPVVNSTYQKKQAMRTADPRAGKNMGKSFHDFPL